MKTFEGNVLGGHIPFPGFLIPRLKLPGGDCSLPWWFLNECLPHPLPTTLLSKSFAVLSYLALGPRSKRSPRALPSPVGGLIIRDKKKRMENFMLERLRSSQRRTLCKRAFPLTTAIYQVSRSKREPDVPFSGTCLQQVELVSCSCLSLLVCGWL